MGEEEEGDGGRRWRWRGLDQNEDRLQVGNASSEHCSKRGKIAKETRLSFSSSF